MPSIFITRPQQRLIPILFALLFTCMARPAFAEGSIQVSHTVHRGTGGAEVCPGEPQIWGAVGDPLVFCYRVRNTGTNLLVNVTLEDASGPVSFPIGSLFPGQSAGVFRSGTLQADGTNTARVAAGEFGSGVVLSDRESVYIHAEMDYPVACLAISDIRGRGGPDQLYWVDQFSGATAHLGEIRPDPAQGVDANCLAAGTFAPPQYGVQFPLFYSVDAGPLCSNGLPGSMDLANQGFLGVIDWVSAGAAGFARWQPFPNPIGVGRGAFGPLPLNDVDAMDFDASPAGGSVLYIAVHQSGERDVLAQVDHHTGRLVPDAYGPGLDYIPVDAVTNTLGQVLADVADMTFDPLSGELWMALTAPGAAGELASVSPDTGHIRFHAPFLEANGGGGIVGVTALNFGMEGGLYATTGSAATSQANTLYQVERVGPHSGRSVRLGALAGTGNFEAIDCFLTQPDSFFLMDGHVFSDDTQNGHWDAGESVVTNTMVTLWSDADESGTLDPFVDFVIDAYIVGLDGRYSFITPNDQHYLLTLEEAALPAGTCGWTTPPVVAVFIPANAGSSPAHLDFGLNPCEASSDSDADGLPDAFETAHGLSLLADNRATDADGDGLTDLWEFVAGSPPRDPRPVGSWLEPVPGPGGGRRFLFTALRAQGPGYKGLTRHYSLEFRPSLQTGDWLPLPGFEDVPGYGQTLSIPLQSSAGFLRARIEVR